MEVAAAVLLSLYLTGLAYALLSPTRGPDPQRGQAIGCLMLVGMGVLLLGAVLAVGVVFRVRFLVQAVFWITVYPALHLALGAGYWLLRRLTSLARRER